MVYSQCVCCLLAGDVDDHFRIGAESGVLYTRGSLDRETQDNYLLSVQARDSAGANSLSSVTQVRNVRGVEFERVRSVRG